MKQIRKEAKPIFAEGRHPMAALGGGGLAPCDAGGAGTHSWPSGCQTSHGCVPPGPPPPGCAPACTEPQHTPSAMHRTPRHCPLYVYIHIIQVWPNKGLFNSNEPFRPAHLFGHAAVNNGGLQKLWHLACYVLATTARAQPQASCASCCQACQLQLDDESGMAYK